MSNMFTACLLAIACQSFSSGNIFWPSSATTETSLLVAYW